MYVRYLKSMNVSSVGNKSALPC
uniref:Uncharacterized protein n=1 Tax=Anguilla anguilla TaxID=7936 RepID=A0A0E9P9Q6_ANGAN